jgi:uncharacterized protein
MRIAVVGGTGMIGSGVVAEAAAREHEVTVASRRGNGPAGGPAVVSVAVDAADQRAMVELFERVDVVVAATRPAPGDEASHTEVTSNLLDVAAKTGRRLVVVGGAAPLLVPDAGRRLVIDTPAYVPDEYRTIAMASVTQLRACQAHPTADWTYVSPPLFIAPGERTGSYRRGTTTLLLDPHGRSSISVEDFAVAVLDEVESPRDEPHFTVASSAPG